MTPQQTLLTKAAQGEDTLNLLEHIAWTDVIKPRFAKLKEGYSKMLVGHLLGQQLPPGLTKEQLAWKIYGLEETEHLFEKILRDGTRAFDELNCQGIHISAENV